MRVIFPQDFAGQRKLLGDIKTKSDADCTSDVLVPLFAEKGINLNADISAGNQAFVHEESMKLFERTAENYVQLRDMRFEPVFSHTRGEIQFLKSFVKPNVRKLGDWGVTVDKRDRINYPPDFAGRVEIVKAIKTKHESYAQGASPLQPYLNEQGIDLNADADAVSDAEAYEALNQKARRDAEKEKQLRDILWNPVEKHLHDIGDYLMKLYRGKEKKAGEYGYTIDDSPRAPKFRISTLKPATQKTLKGIVVGSTLTNVGTVPVHVYKGTSTAGTPAIVHPNEMLGMTKGYSVITVINPSTIETAKIKALTVK